VCRYPGGDSGARRGLARCGSDTSRPRRRRWPGRPRWPGRIGWQSKVAEAQANITCKLLNLYLDGDTVIAEWLAEFDDLVKGEGKRMREIAVLTFEGELISSLREYWASEAVAMGNPSPLNAFL
jgi:ketosteroid isomerase-like protein